MLPYTEGEVSIPAHFETDLATIPRICWIIISPFDLGLTGPIVHDWHYENHILTRRRADEIFRHMILEGGAPGWKCWIAWVMVRLFGWVIWRRFN